MTKTNFCDHPFVKANKHACGLHGQNNFWSYPSPHLGQSDKRGGGGGRGCTCDGEM